jgi:5'-3' exonuclease
LKQVIREKVAKSNNIDTTKKVYHLLVDGNSVLKSSLVSKDLYNESGQEYGAVMLFLIRIGNLLAMRDFNHCVVCWDGFMSGILRYEIYPDYKANRDKHYSQYEDVVNPKSSYDAYIDAYCRKVLEYKNKNKTGIVRRGETDDENFQRQREILQAILDELFVRQYMYDSVEGDDLIAYYCKNKKKEDYIVIVSEDRDLSQLIRDDICLYIPSIKKFVSPKNQVDILGMPASNIVLKKVICGDQSDNIKGVKGMGEKTLEKYYPSIMSEQCTLEGFLDTCRQILEERKSEKKKPIQSLQNALDAVTDGCQGKDLYDINRKIIDLSEPLLTEEARQELNEIYMAPIDPEGRDVKNVYEIIRRNGMSEMYDPRRFGGIFGKYERIKKKEIEFAKDFAE